MRFAEKYICDPNSGCWLWTAALTTTGYGAIGAINSNNKKYEKAKAHRVSWELNRGPIPPGMHVLHKCDTPACVNPNHLFLGTHQENVADMNKKGRHGVCNLPHPRGQDHYTAKLTDSDILEIRTASGGRGTGARLAIKFGVSRSLISMVRSGVVWKHLL